VNKISASTDDEHYSLRKNAGRIFNFPVKDKKNKSILLTGREGP
jgi:hypothetical protein